VTVGQLLAWLEQAHQKKDISMSSEVLIRDDAAQEYFTVVSNFYDTVTTNAIDEQAFVLIKGSKVDE
jgi:hypothetical protein